MTENFKNSAQVRESFIRFFESKGHAFVRSAPVVPQDDPTLMFTNAGMNQFKSLFLGDNPKNLKRAVNSQKCIRVSGKHNDLDEVGRDTYHHTFFEMLGNWSFGDYYKKEAISWAWELLTEVWALDKQRLFVTIYQEDDEAFEIWKQVSGLPDSRIMRFGEESNFWEMGDTGPCGPCTEIHYDIGDLETQEETFSDLELGVNGTNDRYIEIWNNVFMQYERISTGELLPLKFKNVDTGMGFERICAILQGVKSNYDTDVFAPIIQKIAEFSNIPYDQGKSGTPHRVIADHLRALSFAIADGALPSNEGRGYVLRRILRRASRFARLLGSKEAFIYKLVPVLVETMGDAFPEIQERADFVSEVIRAEEERFIRTLDAGLDRFDKIVQELRGDSVIPGDRVFLLYDTYGFPPDLTRILAEEKSLKIDEVGFNEAMEAQKTRARAAQKESFNAVGTEGWVIYSDESTRFVGYDLDVAETSVLRYKEEKGILAIVLENTPFYAEMGGQVGDKGLLFNSDLEIQILDTIKVNDTIIHKGKLSKGTLSQENMGAVFTAKVDTNLRNHLRRNHTATHLLHSALKQVLGSHVTQQGSRVAPESLRFDFNHFSALSPNEIEQIERLVNEQVLACIPVETVMMDLEAAKASGAIAAFGEKYEDMVRVVDLEGFSKELCGGLHVQNSGEIGLFKIISESSVSAGVRRIEAITGLNSLTQMQENSMIVSSLRDQFKTKTEKILERIEELFEKEKDFEKKWKAAKLELSVQQAKSLLVSPIQIQSLSLFIKKLNMLDASFKNLLDGVQSCLNPNDLIVLFNEDKGTGSVAVLSGKKAQEKDLKAGEIVKIFAELLGGRGGGRPDRAQAGTKDLTNMQSVFERAEQLLKEVLNK